MKSYTFYNWHLSNIGQAKWKVGQVASVAQHLKLPCLFFLSIYLSMYIKNKVCQCSTFMGD